MLDALREAASEVAAAMTRFMNRERPGRGWRMYAAPTAPRALAELSDAEFSALMRRLELEEVMPVEASFERGAGRWSGYAGAQARPSYRAAGFRIDSCRI